MGIDSIKSIDKPKIEALRKVKVPEHMLPCGFVTVKNYDGTRTTIKISRKEQPIWADAYGVVGSMHREGWAYYG